ncbi:MAG TPA: hypothetical protein VKX41_15060 [Alloacidobacterium sp.]|jgi:hypothetical protein|nr:hypothetical protein [Alloacidobacterium sp.]
MQPRWILSQFYRDSANRLVPVVADYGGNYLVPTNPAADSGSALVLINIDSHQIDAAKQDPRLVVCPLVFDPSPAPAAVISAYASMGAVSGMSMGALLATLAAAEPVFGVQYL